VNATGVNTTDGTAGANVTVAAPAALDLSGATVTAEPRDDDHVRVEAEVVRAGSSMGVTECEVTTVHEGERKVVATGGTTYRLFRDAN